MTPALRDSVQLLRDHRFEIREAALLFPHIVVATTRLRLVTDAELVASLLGPEWTVEGCYQTHTRQAHLVARTLS